MTIKALFDPRNGNVLTGISQHACMVKAAEFDRMVRAIYFSELNVLYFRYWSPDGVYELTSWGDKKARATCDRALAAFIRRELVPGNVKVLHWETGYGVRDIDIKY